MNRKDKVRAKEHNSSADSADQCFARGDSLFGDAASTQTGQSKEEQAEEFRVQGCGEQAGRPLEIEE